jgi:hypothetical protein
MMGPDKDRSTKRPGQAIRGPTPITIQTFTRVPPESESMRSIGVAVAVLTIGSMEIGQAQVTPGPGWRWAVDKPGSAKLAWNPPDSAWQFVQMAPGWHITTVAPATMYHPAMTAQAPFALETVQILFPGTSQSGYGLFFGGTGLETGAEPAYTSFLVRRDGHAMVEHRVGTRVVALIPWTATPAIQQVTGATCFESPLVEIRSPSR